MTPDRLKRLIYSVLLLSSPPAILQMEACGGAVSTEPGDGGAGRNGASGSGPFTSSSTGTSTVATGGWAGDAGSAGSGGDIVGTTTAGTGGGAGWAGSGQGGRGSGGYAGWAGSAGWGGTGQGGSGIGGQAGWAGSAGSGGNPNNRCVVPGIGQCIEPTDGVIPRDCVAYDAGAPDPDAGTPLDTATCRRICPPPPFRYTPSCSVEAMTADRMWIHCQHFCYGVP